MWTIVGRSLLFVCLIVSPRISTSSFVVPGYDAASPPVQGDTGLELLRLCNAAIRIADRHQQSDMDPIEGTACLEYLSGFTDGYVLATDQKLRHRFCPPPEGLKAEQQARIVAKWLRDNPEQLNGSARISVLVALARAFPCK